LKTIGFIAVLFLCSCQYFGEKIPTEKELLEKRMKEINWQKVDKFPSISNCDVLTDENQQKQCFFDFLKQTIQEKINVEMPKKWHQKTDTIAVKVTVLSNGILELSFDNNTKIDSILKTNLIGFPRISPAIKQGIFVKTQFDLPIVVPVE
jgi:hypothetical protein